jgi:subtilase family serine protease
MISRHYIFGLVVIAILAATTAYRVSADPQRAAPVISVLPPSSTLPPTAAVPPTAALPPTPIITLKGNVRPEVNVATDLGAVPATFRMDHLKLQLRRTPQQEQALEQYIDQLHDVKSPDYHHWLTAVQFGQRFGVGSANLATVSNWLRSEGFFVNNIPPSSMVIDFSGTAGQVQAAFRTSIHNVRVNGVQHFANVSDPQVPAAVAPMVAGIVALHNFTPHTMNVRRTNYTVGGGYYLMVPGDLAKIYNLNPLFNAGYSGQGQTIVVIEDTDVYSTADWDTFRSTLGLSTAFPDGSFTQVHPPSSGVNDCTPPGVNGDDGEAILDAEWASASAPSAAIELASCANIGNFGGYIAMENILNAGGTPPAIISISYGDSESDEGAAANAYIRSLYQQAVTAGVSVFVSSGDQGAAVTDYGASYATHGINVNAFGSTPYNVAVGGTDFSDYYSSTSSTYWGSTNNGDYSSALSYVPEIPWNDSCASVLIADFVGALPTYGSAGYCNAGGGAHIVAAGSGGPSNCATGTPGNSGVANGTCAGYAKPAWQSIYGNPSDGVRDLPDVSLFAANGVWGHYYVVCYSDTGRGGSSCSSTPDTWAGFGGTSISSPIMAGIQALINQSTGSRMGNPNPSYYSVAAAEYGASGNAACDSSLGNGVDSSCSFYDVTEGDMDVPCQGSFNCYTPSGTYGVLSTSNASYLPAFGTQTGWDFATGIGTVNATNLVMALGGGAPSMQLSAGAVAFPVEVLSTTTSKNLTLNNTGIASLTISNIATSGDFTQTNTCGSTVAAGANCQITVKFKPTAAGPRKSAIYITDNATGSPQRITVTGVGTAANLAPTALTFASQSVGTASSAQVVTLTNKGSSAMTMYQIAFVGANAGDFLKTTTCGSTLGAGASCAVSVSFKPTATGTRSASLLFSNNGGGSPQAVALSGTGS